MRFRVSGAQGSEQLLFSVLRHGSSKCGTRYCTPLRSRPIFSHSTKATFSRCLFKPVFFFWGGGGVYFFPSFVLVRFLWTLRKLECSFILKFVREMKPDIHCACPSNGQKSGVRITKGNHTHLCSLFVVCCEYIRLGKKTNLEEELSSQFQFSEGSEGGVCTTQAIHRFYKTL